MFPDPHRAGTEDEMLEDDRMVLNVKEGNDDNCGNEDWGFRKSRREWKLERRR
jgi:hypothetical protein